MGMREPGAFRFLPDLVEACLSSGATSEALEITSWLEERAAAVDHPWADAAAARCRGLLRAAEADWEGASHALGEAIERYRKLPMPFEAARSALILGQGQRRMKLKRAARESLQQALDTFDGLGATAWADRARSELGRVGGRPSTPYELTPSELQVATLVASGRSNRAVAETLHMTVNTVETNLSRIYRKLGVRSRGELAASLRTVPRAAG
jgi:DNA-binding CsgD family transcriptional regulator